MIKFTLAVLLVTPPAAHAAAQQIEVVSASIDSAWHRPGVLAPDTMADGSRNDTTFIVDILPMQSYTIRVESKQFDTYLTVTNEHGQEWSNDDHGASTNSMIELVGAPDLDGDGVTRHRISVTAYRREHGGSFTLSGDPGPVGESISRRGTLAFSGVKGVAYDSVVLVEPGRGLLHIELQPEGLYVRAKTAPGQRRVTERPGSHHIAVSDSGAVLYLIGPPSWADSSYSMEAVRFALSGPSEIVLDDEGELTSADEMLVAGEYHTTRTVGDISPTESILVRLESEELDPFLVLQALSATDEVVRVWRDDDSGGDLNSQLRVSGQEIIGAGGASLRVIITSALPDQTGVWRLVVSRSPTAAGRR